MLNPGRRRYDVTLSFGPPATPPILPANNLAYKRRSVRVRFSLPLSPLEVTISPP
jgi:hypothetical protein